MNAYKEKIQVRMKLVSLTVVAVALVFAGLTTFRDHLPVLPSFIKGFNIGVFAGFELVAVFYLATCMKVRKNETDMKKMFIKESDERTGLIIRNASTLGISVILVGLGISVIVAGFFSTTVFVTLLCSLIFVSIVFYTLWIYYARKL